MANRPLRSWFGKILRLVVVFLLLAGLIDVLVVAGRHAGRLFRQEKPAKEILNAKISDHTIPERPTPGSSSSAGPYDRLIGDPDTHNKPVLKETLHIDVTPERIYAVYDVYLGKDHPLFEVVQTAYGARNFNALVTDVLGRVEVGGNALEFYPATTSISPDDPNAHFYVTSKPIKPTRHNYWVDINYPHKAFNLRFEKREVVVKTKDAQIWSEYNSTPYSKTTDLTVFTREANPNESSFYIYFPDDVKIEPEPPPEPPPRPTLGNLLSRSINPPGLGTLLYGLLGALPFLLFLYWSRKYEFEERQEGFRLKVEAVQIYLAFHFTPFFVFALRDVIERWGNPAIAALRKFQQQTITVFDLPGFREHEVLLPLMVFFVYIWPAMVVRWEQRDVSGRHRKNRVGQILFVITLLALLGWALTHMYAVSNSSFADLSVSGFYGGIFSVLLAGLAGACAWLAFEVFNRRRASTALIVFLLFVFLLALMSLSWADMTIAHSRLATAVKFTSFAIFIITAFVLVASFARLSYRVVREKSVSQEWKEWSNQKRALVVFAILVVSISTRFWPTDYWRLTSLAFALRNLFLLTLIWILFDFLRDKSRNALWLKLPQSTRQVGILLALSLFYSSTARWNYIPIEFLVGFILLDKWLLPTKRFDKSLFAEIRGRLPQIIQKIIDFNDAEKTLGSLKKELLNKVGKGELTHRQYLQKLKGQSKAVGDLQKDLTIEGHFAKRIVLAFGPTDSARENGKRCALYSLLFSAPWTVLFLRNIVRSQAFGGSYLIIDVLSDVTFFLLTWVSYGFIFGYFYPYIKGNNGIQKAVSLFLTIVIPSLAWTALARPLDAASWYLFGFWVLQIFVHTMLLGLVAGDYETLRRAGFRWKHLLEIHRVGALSAWASSVFIAIGAAASALISSGAAQLIASVVKFTTDNFKSPTGQ